MPSTYKGTTTTISKRSEHYRHDGHLEVTLTLTGSWSALQAARSATYPVGSALSGYSSCIVKEATLSREGTGVGTLEVKATTDLAAGGTASGTSVIEIDWQVINKDIRYHRFFLSGAYALNDDDRREIEKALAEPTEANIDLLTSNAKELYDRLVRGQTSYEVYVPVLTRTKRSTGRVTTGGCGKVDTATAVSLGAPVQSANGQAYIYVKTADSMTRQDGRWTQREEWTGFDNGVDTLIIEGT